MCGKQGDITAESQVSCSAFGSQGGGKGAGKEAKTLVEQGARRNKARPPHHQTGRRPGGQKPGGLEVRRPRG